MSSTSPQECFRIGFLTTLHAAEQGFVGGLLITSQLGRPCEFQCTTPVRPNRMQQILYGPTLRAFVIGELIGCTLLDRTQVKPDLVLVEDQETLSIRGRVEPAVALCSDEGPAADNDAKVRLGSQWLTFSEGFEDDRRVVERHAHAVPESADLREPFERVREALQETLRSAA